MPTLDVSTWFLLLVVVVISWVFFRNKKGFNGKLPPGPAGIPFIGCPWILFQDLPKTFTTMSKIWGPVFSVKVFKDTMIILNTPETMREAFAGAKNWEHFSGRPAPFLESENLVTSTVFGQPNDRWAKQRKLVHKILNFYGEGFQNSEASIQDELSHVSELLEKKGKSIDLNDVIYPSLINIITILLKGRRYDYGHPVLVNTELMDDTVSRGGDIRTSLVLTVFPFLKCIPYGPGKIVIDHNRATKQFIKDFFDAEKATYDPNVTRSMTDFLFHHQRESSLPDGNVWLEDKLIKSILQEVVLGGSATTRGALYSFFLIIIHKPDVAKKIQDEIDDVIGTGRFSRLDDRKNMPFTTAATFELLRYTAHTPLGLPHVVLDDVTFQDYHFPRNSTMLANVWNIHHDEKYWTDPWEYKPERFLDAEGHLVPADHANRKNMLSFGIGRRSCIGETFARSRMFLFVTTLLQRFNFRPDPTRPLPSCDPRTYIPGLIMSPKQYYVTVTPRT